MVAISDRPWEGLPPATAAVLRPELPALAEDIIAAISEGVPDYRRDLAGTFGRNLRLGVEAALRRFFTLVEGGEDEGPGREVYVELGRVEMRAGRSLDSLLAAYRLGARVAWRRYAEVGERAGLEPATLYLLAEAVFAYIDEISGESIEGWTAEQAAAAGERQRRRRRLAGLLIQDPPADPASIEAEAVAAGWALPDRLAALVVEGEDPDRLAARLGGEAIATVTAAGLCALVPDPDAPGRHGELEAVVGDGPAALGHPVPWREAAASAERARAATRLARPGLVAAADHELELLLGGDPALAAELAARVLAPLDAETPASRERLLQTLRAWLARQGRTEQVAEELHVHPQTVRYRMGRARDLLGDRLDDPESRFELDLALRVAGAPGG